MRARIAASIVLAAALSLGTAGCTFFAPVATQLEYNPSDGVSVNVGDIAVRNAFAITTDGKSLNLVMVVLNNGTQDVTVQFQPLGDGVAVDPALGRTVTIPAGQRVSFGNPGAPQVTLEGVQATLGGLLPMFVQYGNETGKIMQVPVLDTVLPGYETLDPTPTPTLVPTEVPTPKPSATAVPPKN